jgi:hypothetical protein
MTERQKKLIEKTFDYLEHYLYINNIEPENIDVLAIANLQKDRDIVRTLKKELLGSNYS